MKLMRKEKQSRFFQSGHIMNVEFKKIGFKLLLEAQILRFFFYYQKSGGKSNGK